MRPTVWFAFFAVACGGDGGPDTIVPRDTETIDRPDPPPTTTETGVEGSFVDATYYSVTARFGFDPDTQQHVPYAENGEGFSPVQLAVTLIDSSAALDGVLTAENSCEVVLEVDGSMPVASWVAGQAGWVGFDVPAGATVRDRCKNYGLPGAFADSSTVVSQWSWGVGIGELSELARETLEQTLPASQWSALEPYAAGAIGHGTGFTTGYGGEAVTSGFARAYQVDGNFEIVVGGTGDPEPIPVEQIHLETGVARAYYEVTLGPFLAVALTQQPPSR